MKEEPYVYPTVRKIGTFKGETLFQTTVGHFLDTGQKVVEVTEETAEEWCKANHLRLPCELELCFPLGVTEKWDRDYDELAGAVHAYKAKKEAAK